MNAFDIPQAEPNRFWDFSIDFYRREGVEFALLFLQKRYGFNVNLLLCFLWQASLGGGGLSQIKVRSLMTVVAPWHNKVVLPLRRLRQTLKASSLDDPNLYELRSELSKEELNAEEYEQLMLYQELWMVSRRKRSPVQIVADVCRSVSSYCYLMQVKADDHLALTIDSLIHSLIPEFPLEEIAKISSQRLHNHPKMSKVAGTQLWIDL